MASSLSVIFLHLKEVINVSLLQGVSAYGLKMCLMKSSASDIASVYTLKFLKNDIMPVIPALWVAKAGRSLDPRSLRPAWAT